MEKRIGVTRSGRVYEFVDDRYGISEMRDASYVWEVWKQHNSITQAVDVTEQFIPKSDEDGDE